MTLLSPFSGFPSKQQTEKKIMHSLSVIDHLQNVIFMEFTMPEMLISNP